MKAVSNVREAIDIAMNGGQASVTNNGVTMIAGDGEQIFISECDHFFDDGLCLLCDAPDPAEQGRDK